MITRGMSGGGGSTSVPWFRGPFVICSACTSLIFPVFLFSLSLGGKTTLGQAEPQSFRLLSPGGILNVGPNGSGFNSSECLIPKFACQTGSSFKAVR